MNAQLKPPAAREVLRAAITARDEAAPAYERPPRRWRAPSASRPTRSAGSPRSATWTARFSHATAAYRTFAEAGGERPDLGTPPHLAERQRTRNAVRRELAAAQAAQAELADGHAAAQRQQERCEREVAAAADAVIAEMALALYGGYARAVEAARAAWDDLEVICGMTVSTGAPLGRPYPAAGPASWALRGC
jgi:hypothetical protein